MTSPPAFPGFPDFRANVTFVPLQFFTVVLPHRSRGCVRLVGFMIRRLLGWVDTDGDPTHEQLEFSYRELMNEAGLSREAIADALAEAQAHHLIGCVRAPRPDGSGQPAHSGIYALRWHDDYTNAPADFMGFCRREAVPVSEDEAGRPVTGAKAARKNIPNAFFDYLLRRERLSLVRVVGAMLFRSIQWGPGGERKVPVTLSISELGRLTRMSRRHVHQAVQQAMTRGYVERVREGRFDPRAGGQSQAATYRIRWTAPPVHPVFAPAPAQATTGLVEQPAPYPFSDRSEKGYGEAVQKGIRHQSEKGNGDRSEKGNDISIKRSIKNKTAAAEASSPPVAAAADGVVAQLLAAGFNEGTARHLARHYAAAAIEEQLAWLPQRQAHTNRLGLLRRAIEGNWPKPEASAPSPEHALGAIFVGHFEAALHGYAEPPAGCSPKEAALAAGFLRELTGSPTGGTEQQAAEWGRRFGHFVRAQSPPKPWFVWLLRMHGGEFRRQSRQAVQRDEKVSVAQPRRAHEKAFAAGYHEHLREVEARLQREQPALHAAFETHREAINAQFNLSEATRALLASEPCRRSAFVDFLREHSVPVPDFWTWDRQFNAQRWPGVAPAAPVTPGVPVQS